MFAFLADVELWNVLLEVKIRQKASDGLYLCISFS